MESIQIYLNSIDGDKFYNGLTSDVEFYLHNIEIADDCHIYLSVNKCSIPYSFYNINNNNNSISLYDSILLTTTNFVIPVGNYSILQLISVLNQNMSNYAFTYNNINNKISITGLNDFQFLYNSTCLTLLGFNTGVSYNSINKILTSLNCIDLTPIKIIYIDSNLLTYNINKSAMNNQSILCCIPVYTAPYTTIQYINYNNYRTNLFINTISSIHIKLIDEYGHNIDLNNLHFSLTIQLDIVKFT